VVFLTLVAITEIDRAVALSDGARIRSRKRTARLPWERHVLEALEETVTGRRVRFQQRHHCRLERRQCREADLVEIGLQRSAITMLGLALLMTPAILAAAQAQEPPKPNFVDTITVGRLPTGGCRWRDAARRIRPGKPGS
jgi:hypothetical protein